LGVKAKLLQIYTWIRLTYTRLHDWNTRRIKDKEEHLRIRQEKELELLEREAESLEAQLKTIQLENEMAQERRKLRNT